MPGPAFDGATLAAALAAASGLPTNDDEVARIAAAIGDTPESLLAAALRARRAGEIHVTTVATADHSQWGEFRQLLKALVARGTDHGIVVDAGTRGRDGSNSYDLIAGFGWRGLLIEASPARAALIPQEFGEGDYAIECCAVGLEPGRLPLHLGPGGYMNSLDRSIVELYSDQVTIEEVEVRRLDDILDSHDIPVDFDLLSIDIEGPDVAVLNDLIATSRYRPRYVIVEVEHAFRHSVEELGFGPEVLGAYRELTRTLPNIIFERIT